MMTYYKIFWKLELRRAWCKFIYDHDKKFIIEGRHNMANCKRCGKVLHYVMKRAAEYEWE